MPVGKVGDDVGKKSRLKRERRSSDLSEPVQKILTANSMPQSNPEFESRKVSLREHFSNYNASDIVLSLGVSGLWMPNRSSLVKLTFAYQVCLSMPADGFSGAKSVVSYEAFTEFLEGLMRLLPRLPMLEDFVPEADWGDVCVSGVSGFEPIFYGGSVERIPDFIEAFRLLAADQPQALADMNLAVALQRHLVQNIPRDLVGSTEPVSPGHMETPPPEFWAVCRQALADAHAVVQPLMPLASDWTVAEQGSVHAPDTLGAFTDQVMTETALPLLLVRLGEQVLPVAPRSASSTVLDLWSERLQPHDHDTLRALARRLGHYLSVRFAQGQITAGPMRVVGDAGRFEPNLAAVLQSGNRFHFLVLLKEEELPQLDRIERQLKAVVNTSQRWGLVLQEARQIMEFRDAHNNLLRGDNIELLGVVAHADTQPRVLELPRCTARVIGLPDMVSLFDSLEDGAELERFWAYLESHSNIAGGFAGLVDHFAAFRDSHALLIPGAVTPTFISMDPHWSADWRFRELQQFWRDAPARFPDDARTWHVEPMEMGMCRLRAKGALVLAWSGSVVGCTVQATMLVDEAEPDVDNGPLLELFVHCVVDALTLRASALTELAPFQRAHVVLKCEMSPGLLPVDDEAEAAARVAQPLMDAWRLVGPGDHTKLEVEVQVNIARLCSRLNDAKDASFEVECASAVASGLCALLNAPCDEGVLKQLSDTAGARPRFTLRALRRTVDVPDYGLPDIPGPEQFKIARKELAVILKDHGVEAASRYELEPAKQVMNAARDEMRRRLHARIAGYDRSQLLRVCVEHHDRLTSRYQHEVTRLKISFGHDVSYDRASRLAELQEENTSMARNYRYLLECCLSLEEKGTARPSGEDVVQLIASIDWLYVLYGASDTLHNGVDVGGIELDSSYVPTVFFSEGREEKDQQFLLEAANAKLGVGLQEDDEVGIDRDADRNWGRLDAAMAADWGCSLTGLTQVLEVLTRWHSAGGADELAFQYMATPAAIADKVREHFPDAPADQVATAIAFLTLDPAGIRRLARREESEPDVPVWEHFKRLHRYTIRPLVPLPSGQVLWGAATTSRTRSIWLGSFSSGYLPADFAWPGVVRAVEDIKRGIEKQLEVRAHEVCGRYTGFALRGIDFRRRFPQERFDDVGDFDVLAYWPDRNLWLAVECKYNQPPFCLKDARRLRDRVFGDGDDRAQFAKIERRLEFLRSNLDHLRSLLDWPAPGDPKAASVRATYVSRELHWFLLHPPYPVETSFVRVDALDGWLSRLLASEPTGHSMLALLNDRQRAI